MIDWETAHRIATQHVSTITLAAEGDQAVVDDRWTVAYDFGWLFHYQSSWFLQTDDDRWMLLDYHPFLLHKGDGTIIPMPRISRAELLDHYGKAWAGGTASS